MSQIKWWFLGFREGFWKPQRLPYGANNAHTLDLRAYYSGFMFAAYIRGIR